jgi:hypothetical protein
LKRVYDIGESIDSYGLEIEYELRMNHAGRILIEDGNVINDDDDNDDDNVDDDNHGNKNENESNRKAKRRGRRHFVLPLSVWPTVLERSYRKNLH